MLGVFRLVTKRAMWRPLLIAMAVGLVAVLISVSTLATAPFVTPWSCRRRCVGNN
jgi:hypothetical protein